MTSRTLAILVFLAGSVSFGGCAKVAVNGSAPSGSSYAGGGSSNDVFINQAIIDSVNSSNSRIVIDLSDQRARLYKGSELAIETPVSTGMRGKETPTGSFRILEKKRVKDSNLYGVWVDGVTGQLLDTDGDSRRTPSGGRPVFQGSPMPYWLKVTPGGAGMHVGYVARVPISHGCIRVPRKAQALIFEKAAVGTPVTIRS